jgi:hypothetical protein
MNQLPLTTKQLAEELNTKKPHIYHVGIDPQPSLIAVYAETPNNEVLAWFQLRLQRKDSYKSSEDWGIYIANQCKLILREFRTVIFTHHEANPTGKPPVIVLTVEQQRGRVNSLIEGYLVGVAVDLNMSLFVPHPNKWKSKVKLECEPGNKANKDAALTRYGKEYIKYCKLNGRNPEKRIHDVCDARCLVEYGKVLISNASEMSVSSESDSDTK